MSARELDAIAPPRALKVTGGAALPLKTVSRIVTATGVVDGRAAHLSEMPTAPPKAVVKVTGVTAGLAMLFRNVDPLINNACPGYCTSKPTAPADRAVLLSIVTRSSRRLC